MRNERSIHPFALHLIAVAAVVAQGFGPAATLLAAEKNEAKKESAAMPVVVEHKYRMLAKVRPVLFWISKDDVGGARISWRGDETGGYGLDLLIGSDPQRAPRNINKWGYIAEQVQGADARVIGVMKQSNEQSIAEAESQLDAEGRRGGFAYSAILGTASGKQAQAGVTTVRVPRDLTFRDIGTLLEMVNTAKGSAEQRSVALPAGAHPGLLLALQSLVKQSADGYAQAGAGFKPMRTPATFVYFGTLYDLTMKSSELVKTATIDARKYTNVVRSDFEIKNRSTGETTRFQLTYGTTGALAGVPVHAIYQPRWWFEVQLFLDENTAF